MEIPASLKIFNFIYEYRLLLVIPLAIIWFVFTVMQLYQRKRKAFFITLASLPLVIMPLAVATTWSGWHYRMELRDRFATNANINQMPPAIYEEYAKHDFHPRLRDVNGMIAWNILLFPLMFFAGGLAWRLFRKNDTKASFCPAKSCLPLLIMLLALACSCQKAEKAAYRDGNNILIGPQVKSTTILSRSPLKPQKHVLLYTYTDVQKLSGSNRISSKIDQIALYSAPVYFKEDSGSNYHVRTFEGVENGEKHLNFEYEIGFVPLPRPLLDNEIATLTLIIEREKLDVEQEIYDDYNRVDRDDFVKKKTYTVSPIVRQSIVFEIFPIEEEHNDQKL